MNPQGNQPQPHYVKVGCEHCDGGIEFDANQFGDEETRTVECPHCGMETLIFVAEEEEPRQLVSVASREELQHTSAEPEKEVQRALESWYVSRVYVSDIQELVAIARHLARILDFEIDRDAIEQIARSADGAPTEVLKRLRFVRDHSRSTALSGRITADIASEALKLLPVLVRLFDQYKKIEVGTTTEVKQIRRPIPSQVRIEVWRRDNGRCVRCGSRRNLEYDHIIPVRKGGSNTARNIELLCQDCNRQKRDAIR